MAVTFKHMIWGSVSLNREETKITGLQQIGNENNSNKQKQKNKHDPSLQLVFTEALWGAQWEAVDFRGLSSICIECWPCASN